MQKEVLPKENFLSRSSGFPLGYLGLYTLETAIVALRH